MRILYRQDSDNRNSSILPSLNISNCHFKKIKQQNGLKTAISKSHWHEVYEIHIIFDGEQSYEIDGASYLSDKNSFLLISPKTKYRVIYTPENLVKYSVTFNCEKLLEAPIYCGTINERISECIKLITEEFTQKKSFRFCLSKIVF